MFTNNGMGQARTQRRKENGQSDLQFNILRVATKKNQVTSYTIKSLSKSHAN